MKPLMIETSRLHDWHGEFEEIPILEIQDSIAILPIYGFLTKRPGPFADFYRTTSYEEIDAELQKALENPLVTQIILDIDSPGGEVSGLFDLCDFIYQSRSKKPIEAIANDDAFSAAYAIASSAQHVWCTRTSGLGSIGVIATHYDQSQFDQKEGLKITPIFAGKHKNDLSPHAPLSKEALESTQSEMNRLYTLFIETVARNRNLSKEKVQSTEAALFFGSNAMDHGLADGLRTLHDLIAPSPKDSNAMMNPLCSTPKRRLSMENSPLEEKSTLEEEIQPQETLENEKSPLEAPQKEIPQPETPEAHVMDLVKLCKIANRPELLVQWLERNMTVTEAQESLLKEMEAQPHIASAHFQPKPPENPLIQAAKSRVQH